VTNLPHYSSNVAIRHNDATRRCDGDVTLRRDFALSRHNRQRWFEVLLGFRCFSFNVLALQVERFQQGCDEYIVSQTEVKEKSIIGCS
jgi:hypothetical protein